MNAREDKKRHKMGRNNAKKARNPTKFYRRQTRMCRQNASKDQKIVLDLLDRGEAKGTTFRTFKGGRCVSENCFAERNSIRHPIEDGGGRDHSSLVGILMNQVLLLMMICHLLMVWRSHDMSLPICCCRCCCRRGW